MSTWTRALVTGASGGIGRELALLLAEQGTALVLVARSREALEDVAATARASGVDVEVLVADLTDPAGLESVEQRLSAEQAPVDLLVNNAGYGSYGRFEELDLEGEAGQVRLNVLALVRLTHVGVRAMRRQGRGGVLQVGSVAGMQPVPRNATYAATKSFVNAFSQSLHEELAGTGITVTLLAPGFTRTGFQDRAEVASSAIPGPAWMEARPVAQAALDGLARGRAVVVPGALNRVTSALVGVTPDALSRRIAGLVVRRVG